LSNRVVTSRRFVGLVCVIFNPGDNSMLSCQEVAQRASALIDGELGPFDRFQMWLHLAMCNGCSTFVRQMKTTKDLTQSAAPQDDLTDAGVDNRISAILSQLRDGKQPGH